MKVIAICGSYRKGKVIDTALSEILRGAEAEGAQTSKLYLIDKHIEFCKNCRSCTQDKKVDGNRGRCTHNDDMEQILKEIDTSDAVVLGSPINFSTVTAVMKKFIERLIVYSYWPEGVMIPRPRTKGLDKKAIVVTSSSAPSFIGRILMPNALSIMKIAARCLGARVVKSMYFGKSARKPDSTLYEKNIGKVFAIGKELARNVQVTKGVEDM